MLIDAQEMKLIDALLEQANNMEGEFRYYEKECLMEHFSRRPYLLFPFGYDEALIVKESTKTSENILSCFVLHSGKVFTPSIRYRAILRKTLTGERWLLGRRLEGHGEWDLPPYSFLFHKENEDEYEEIPLERIVDELRALSAGIALQGHNTLLLPSAFTEPYILPSKIALCDATTSILKAILQSRLTLSEVSWRDLENIVAEIFRDRGLHVVRTKHTRDGGRDLLVHGEFFPGVELTMAVEVTVQRKVGIRKVATALYQNRHYPLLMVVTSGRFSSGVIETSKEPENKLRLLLRDGLSISRWIHKSMGNGTDH